MRSEAPCELLTKLTTQHINTKCRRSLEKESTWKFLGILGQCLSHERSKLLDEYDPLAEVMASCDTATQGRNPRTRKSVFE
jgi:hypothetical protein